jgi:hypothetical protein
MRVDLLRRGDVGVAEDDLRIARRSAQILEQRGRGVAEGMQPDLADTVCVAEMSEGPDQVAGLDWAAGTGREDKPGRSCCAAHRRRRRTGPRRHFIQRAMVGSLQRVLLRAPGEYPCPQAAQETCRVDATG